MHASNHSKLKDMAIYLYFSLSTKTFKVTITRVGSSEVIVVRYCSKLQF